MLLRVVIFDNDDDSLDAINYGLSCHGYEVVCFNVPNICPVYTNDSSECPQEYACGDILIVENEMPRMSGLEFIRQQATRGCKAKVEDKAVISGGWSSGEVETAEQLGCRIFTKPVDMAEVSAWLEGRIQGVNPARALATINL